MYIKLTLTLVLKQELNIFLWCTTKTHVIASTDSLVVFLWPRDSI